VLSVGGSALDGVEEGCTRCEELQCDGTVRNTCNQLSEHKVLTYVEYRALSGVFQNIDPPPPFHPASVSSPLTKGAGGYTLAGRWGGVNILEDARHWIGPGWPLTV
jgi:hypothetical protein